MPPLATAAVAARFAEIPSVTRCHFASGRRKREVSAELASGQLLVQRAGARVQRGPSRVPELRRGKDRFSVHVAAPLDKALAPRLSGRLSKLEAAMPSVPRSTRF